MVGERDLGIVGMAQNTYISEITQISAIPAASGPSLLAAAHGGQAVGVLRAAATRRYAQAAVTLTLRTAPRPPSLWWRLLRP